MATENKMSQEELLKTIEGVLDEALAIYESESGDVKKAEMGIDDKKDISSMMAAKPKAVSAPGLGDASTQGIMAKDEDKKEDKKDKDDKEEDSDEKVMEHYKSLVAKMEKRGLMQKAQPAPTMQKSETAEDAVSDLRKSIDERFASMGEAIKGVAETVKKIASQPRERKSLTGYQPLKKNEGPAPLKKSDVVGKLLELKKSGDPRVDTTFITRIEQGRLAKGDDDKLRALGIVE